MTDHADRPASPSQAPLKPKDHVLETGASMVQDFTPIKQICAHLNAFHVYADDPSRCVEANHYCTHLNEDVRQCLVYDSPEKGARLIGVEYLVTPKVFSTLPMEERKLWHSHVFEVKSGMLIMPQPSTSITPSAAWNTAETSEMHEIAPLYGKTYHLWQVDRGDVVPMGEPKLMASFTNEQTVEKVVGKPTNGELPSEKLCQTTGRDERFRIDIRQKRQLREGIEEAQIMQGELPCP
ncbi:MAG: hypothetical protein Q9227_009456 [Pyrenula ochraceoflavens]